MTFNSAERSAAMAHHLLGSSTPADLAFVEAGLALSRWAEQAVVVIEYDHDNDTLYIDFDSTAAGQTEEPLEASAEVEVELAEALAYTWTPAAGFVRVTGVCLTDATTNLPGGLGAQLRTLVGDAAWREAHQSVVSRSPEPVTVPIGSLFADQLLQRWTLMVSSNAQSDKAEDWARELTDKHLQAVVAEWTADLLQSTAASYRADETGTEQTLIQAVVGDEAFASMLSAVWTPADGLTSVEITVADRLMTVSVPLPGVLSPGLSVQACVDLGDDKVYVQLGSSTTAAGLPGLLSGTHELEVASVRPRRVTLTVHAEAA